MEQPNSKMRRCAVYTRKSSEEGLEQNFNSLHAQRDACESFIKSQAGEGWWLVKTSYDDGGLSGGSMERPGLQRLLSDIREKLIDVVVVYKVDRLTRSLADFAKMVEVFDSKGVSFVSVTQQFNTTTSMGRLTLNVLLSFAQFEREVTGERIRVIVDGETGLLFERGSIGELAAKTLLAAREPELRARIGANALEQIRGHSIEQAVAAYLSIIRQVTHSAAPALEHE